MNLKEYRGHTRDWFMGRKVKLLNDIGNNGGQYAIAGTICEITDKRGGFGLKVPHCSHGLGLCISKVDHRDVELVNE